MQMEQVSPEMLKQAVFELVGECRRALQSGSVDVSQVNRGVQAYCEALASLPAEEARRHRGDLQGMMDAVTALGGELAEARDAVRGELHALGHLKRANVAYQKSDAVGGVFVRRGEDSES